MSVDDLLPLAALLAIVPGYITIFIATRNSTWQGVSGDLATVLQSLALSAVVQLLISPYTLRIMYPLRNSLAAHPNEDLIWLALSFVVIPVILGVGPPYLGKELFPEAQDDADSRFRRLARRILWPLPPPTVWDWTFRQGIPQGCYVRIDYADGHRIGGVYSPPAASMTSPQRPGIYLAVEWRLNERGDFVAPVAHSSGIIVPIGDDVRSVRLLRGETDDERAEREQRQRTASSTAGRPAPEGPISGNQGSRPKPPSAG